MTSKWPRAPRGYRTDPETGRVLKIAKPVGPEWCGLGGRLVSETHRRRKNHVCPRCGATVGWSTVLHPDLWFWDKHVVASGVGDQLDAFDTLDGPVIDSDSQGKDTDDDCPF